MARLVVRAFGVTVLKYATDLALEMDAASHPTSRRCADRHLCHYKWNRGCKIIPYFPRKEL